MDRALQHTNRARGRPIISIILSGVVLVCLPTLVGAAPPEPDPDEVEASEDAPEPEEPRWIKHRIVPGELLGDIAERYRVSPDKLIRWNKLDEKNPKIFAGRHLRVYTKHVPPAQYKITYTVKKGDTWGRVAKAHRVDADTLRTRWNPKVARKFKIGQEIVIWLDPLDDPDYLREQAEAEASGAAKPEAAVAEGGAEDGTASEAVAAGPPLPLVAIPRGSVSVGKPSRGKLVNSAQLPVNRQLYTLRKPDEAYGSSHTLENLQLAVARWRRDTGFGGALKIGSISKKGGGKLKPHSSHRSGRDVDIRLPLKRKKGEADNVNDVDWDALWVLVMALVDTGEVDRIYLTTDRQKHLHAAAKRARADSKTIDRVLQYPETGGRNNGIVRHSKGHTGHIHVRFSCADNESSCENH
jgi:murein endopeptidase/LysM repeat protein